MMRTPLLVVLFCLTMVGCSRLPFSATSTPAASPTPSLPTQIARPEWRYIQFPVAFEQSGDPPVTEIDARMTYGSQSAPTLQANNDLAQAAESSEDALINQLTRQVSSTVAQAAIGSVVWFSADW